MFGTSLFWTLLNYLDTFLGWSQIFEFFPFSTCTLTVLHFLIWMLYGLVQVFGYVLAFQLSSFEFLRTCPPTLAFSYPIILERFFFITPLLKEDVHSHCSKCSLFMKRRKVLGTSTDCFYLVNYPPQTLSKYLSTSIVLMTYIFRLFPVLNANCQRLQGGDAWVAQPYRSIFWIFASIEISQITNIYRCSSQSF